MRNATPLNPRSHSHDPLSESSCLGSPTANLNHVDVMDPAGDLLNLPGPSQDKGPTMLSSHTYMHQHQVRSNHLHGPQSTYTQPQGNSHLHQDCPDAVILNLQAFRTNPIVSDAVNNLLASYKARAHSDLTQGKQKRSDRYHTHDTITVQAHLKMPNKGFHASTGRKCLTYDKLSLPQWVAGQLTNIYAI